MDNEWLARYRAHNDALARRLEVRMEEKKPYTRPEVRPLGHISELMTTPAPSNGSGLYVPAQHREIADVQIAKLFVSRIHRVAARLQDAELRRELYELADDVEQHLEAK